MLAYLAAVWKYRYFWLSLVRMDLRTRYRGSMLGIAWSLVHPLAMTGILCVAFGRLLNVDLRFYAPSLMVGLTFWSYLVSSAIGGGNSFFIAETYIRQRPTPLAMCPLRTVLGTAFRCGVALCLADLR